MIKWNISSLVYLAALSTLVFLSACAPNQTMTKEERAALGEIVGKAENGNSAAQFEIAEKYDYAQGVKQNYEKAAYWYLEAANKNHGEAQCRIANRYHDGVGIQKSRALAYRWSYLCRNNSSASTRARELAYIHLTTTVSIPLLSMEKIQSIEKEANEWKKQF